jgi:hypothetical protein
VLTPCTSTGSDGKLAKEKEIRFFFFQPSGTNRMKCISGAGHGNQRRENVRRDLGPGVYSASSRNEYHKQKIMFLGSKARPVTKADNLVAICEPTV